MLLAFMIMSYPGFNVWSSGSVLERQMSLIAETMLADVRCDFLVCAPTSEAEAKRGIRDNLIELVTVVGVVCKLVRSCLLVSTFSPQPRLSLTVSIDPPQAHCKTALKQRKAVAHHQICKRSTPQACSKTRRASATTRGLDVMM